MLKELASYANRDYYAGWSDYHCILYNVELHCKSEVNKVASKENGEKRSTEKPRKQHQRQHKHVTQQLLLSNLSPKVMSLAKQPLGLMTH
ncbi:hypothetical protein F2Q69_00025886 [Brassica cretica]|uniref:Uncharacterized protein n=1 Tax=Brassica cretica TaxID=69181 RepID=A0A8S9S633_BRACR|nr:hypothetical protein F2Q69_00025886 [Brassica cretica]